MGHDNHDHDHHDHHHVDDLGGFSFFRVVWPAALLLLVVFITKNCCTGCCGDSCEKPGAKHEMHQEHGGGHGEGHEHAPAEEGAHH